MKNLIAISLLSFFAVSSLAESDTVQVKLIIQNGKFEPSEIKVPVNKRIELMVENKGPGPEEFESKSLKREKVIPVGQTVKITLGMLKKGTYGFFGDYHSDTAQGKIIAE